MLVMGWDRINVVGIYVTSITEIHGTMNIKLEDSLKFTLVPYVTQQRTVRETRIRTHAPLCSER